jgi:hypothetical protein
VVKIEEAKIKELFGDESPIKEARLYINFKELTT